MFFAEQLPNDKSALVEKLQQEGHIVAFVGDGINDAQLLQRVILALVLNGNRYCD